jgi:hypothetical protein
VPSAVYRSSCAPGSFRGGATGPHPATVANTATQIVGAVSSSATPRLPHRRWSTSTNGRRGMKTTPEWFKRAGGHQGVQVTDGDAIPVIG